MHAVSTMPFVAKVVLHCPTGYHFTLDQLVEQFISDGVKFVGVVGHDCQRVEDIIDELVVGDGDDPDRFLLTSSHPGETVADVVEFARLLFVEDATEAQVIELPATT